MRRHGAEAVAAGHEAAHDPLHPVAPPVRGQRGRVVHGAGAKEEDEAVVLQAEPVGGYSVVQPPEPSPGSDEGAIGELSAAVSR